MATQEEMKSLLNAIKADAAVPAEIKEKAEQALSEMPAYRSDIWIYRLVVIVLGLTVLFTVAGGLGLAFTGAPNNYKIPPELVALGSAAIGALAGLLAPSPRESRS